MANGNSSGPIKTPTTGTPQERQQKLLKRYQAQSATMKPTISGSIKEGIKKDLEWLGSGGEADRARAAIKQRKAANKKALDL